mgnify:CR=1 FL=1
MPIWNDGSSGGPVTRRRRRTVASASTLSMCAGRASVRGSSETMGSMWRIHNPSPCAAGKVQPPTAGLPSMTCRELRRTTSVRRMTRRLSGRTIVPRRGTAHSLPSSSRTLMGRHRKDVPRSGCNGSGVQDRWADGKKESVKCPLWDGTGKA